MTKATNHDHDKNRSNSNQNRSKKPIKFDQNF